MRAGTGETELAFSGKPEESDQPPSWFSSGLGTKADAKQQSGRFCAFIYVRERPKRVCARLNVA